MGDMFLDRPLDRQMIQDRKMAKLQAEIAAVESRMSENAALQRHLESINDAERERSQRVIDKMHGRNNVLKDEIDRFYQTKSPVLSPSLFSLGVNDVIARRTKEFSQLQHEKALQYKYLMAEKQRLQVAQEKLREKRMAMHRMPTPEDGNHRVPRPPSMESAHSDASYLHRAAIDLPYAVDRIWRLKERLRDDYEKKGKPYRGELGIESYEAWQIEDYVWIRKLVEDFVDDFVNKYLGYDYSYVEKDFRMAMYKANDEEWERTAGALTERKVVQLVAEEILLQETKAVMRMVAAEVLHVNGTFKNMVDIQMMREAEFISTGREVGREKDDPAYNLVTKSYFMFQHNRNKFKKDLWTHSQSLFTNKETQEKEDEITDTEVELITYHHLHPSDLKKYIPSHFDPVPVKKMKEQEVRYHKRETEFWTHMQPSMVYFEIPQACQGVAVMKPSVDGNFMAIGTANGDILVYDVQLEPWRLGRVAFSAARSNNSVVDLAWSLDGTKIISIHTKGNLEVWDTEGPSLDRNITRTLELQPDIHGNLPKRLGLIGSINAASDGFKIQFGPLAESEVVKEKVGPVKGGFFPSFSFFGVQHSICAALDNKDIIKINVEPLSAGVNKGREDVTYPEAPSIYRANIYDESHGVNLVGQNLDAELFRQHQFPILYMGFIDNMSRLVTVDSEGYINIWKYDVAFLSGLGYFVPQRKYKLDFSKKMYTPSNTDKPKVIFTDSVKSIPRSQAEIARERAGVQRQLDKMNLGDPWHEEVVLEKNLVTSVYAPRGGIRDSGAMFNIVLRHERTKQLSTYLTRMYKPVMVKATKLLGVIPTPTGRELVFILLFPAYPPKEAHMMVLVLDLMTMKLRDLRRDIHLPNNEHNRLVNKPSISFSISRVLGPTGADYLFVLMEGRIRCISLNTGSLVLRAEDPRKPSGFTGCIVDEKFVNLATTAQTACTGCRGTVYVAMYDKTKTSVQVLQLTDGNDYEGRRFMWKAFQQSEYFRRVPREVRLDATAWTLSDVQHVEVDMGRLILDLVDEKIFGIVPGQDKDGDTRRTVRDKVEQYKQLQQTVEERGLLDEGAETYDNNTEKL